MRLPDSVVKYRWIFLIGSVLFALPFLLAIPYVKTVDNVDYFTLDHDPDLQFYDELKETFGNDEFFVIALKRDQFFTKENLELLKEITEKIEGLAAVRQVKSLANIDDTVGGDAYFEVRNFLETIPESQQDLAELKNAALQNPLYANNLISKDGKTAAIVIFPFQQDEDPGYRKTLIKKCDEILAPYQGDSDQDAGNHFWMAGWTVTNLYLSQYLKSDMALFIPLTYLFILLCVYLVFGNIRFTLIALANITICVGSTVGLFYYTGIRLNNVTSIVPPLIMALALCDTVHIFSHMEKAIYNRMGDKKEALGHVLQSVFMPCLLTTLTTAVGFLSLCISDMPPIREFALMASAGMGFELIFSFLFLPPLLSLSPPEKIFLAYQDKKWMSGVLNGTHHFVRKNSRVIVLISTFAVGLSVWMGSGIRVETNLLNFFKENSPVRKDLAKVEKELSGIGTIDISLQAEEADAFKHPEHLRLISNIQNFMAQLDGVDAVNSFADFVKDINKSFHNEDDGQYRIPDSKALIAQYMLLYDSEDIDDFINSDFDHARIAARTHVYSTGGQKRLIEKIEQYLSEMDHQGLSIRVSGRAVHDVVIIDSLVYGQVASLGLAAGIIFLVLFAVLRSFKTWCLSIIPNLFPIALNFGIMGALDIPLDTATSLISAVAIGIAVDDTIHFLYEYKKQRETGWGLRESLDRIFNRKGRAIFISSCILCIGFGVMAFSNFIPIVSFGMLSAIIMVTAVIGDLVVLPAVLYLAQGAK